MPRIDFAPRARIELAQILIYIRSESGSHRATAVDARISKALKTLAVFPRMGQPVETKPENLRRFSIPPWIVFYRQLDAHDGIEVRRILDGRRDLSDIL